jgi:hypothetical protein
VSAELFLSAQQPLILNALINNSASARGFIYRFLVKLKNIRTHKTSYTKTFILADNRATIEKITDYIIVSLKIGNYNENALFFVTVGTSSVNNVCALALSLMQLMGTNIGRACRRP